MENEFSIIGFYVILMILLNSFSVAYGETFITNADFLNEESKSDYSADVFGTLNFLLFVEVPESSNIINAIEVYRAFYWFIVVPYSILIGYIIVRLIRGV